MKGPTEWPELRIPEWFPERAEALIAQMGEERPESRAFRQILTAGHIEEKAIDYVDFIAGKTENLDAIQLAIDISQHCFTTIKCMTLIPLSLSNQPVP
jgi:hypothetical protein